MKAQDLNTLQASVKPCPFCAGRAVLAPLKGASGWWRVRCEDYHCGGTTWALQGSEDAVEVWNRRPTNGEA
jgi:hypothetical protein